MATIKLTPASGKIAGTSHANMPLAIIPSEVTNLGSLTQAEADSSRIYTDSGLVTEIPREITSNDEVHTKVTSLDSSSELYFDHDSIRSDYAATDTFGAEAVWVDYETVVHMETETDSTGNQTISNTGGTATTGKIEGAYAFGDNNYWDLGTLSTANGTYTWDIWVYRNTAVTFSTHFLMDTLSGRAAFALRGVTATNNEIAYYDGAWRNLGVAASVDSWDKLTLVSDGSNVDVYRNGISISSNTHSMPSMGSTFGIVMNTGDAGSSIFDGDIDESRVRASTLSANWITTEYNNQNDNAAFWVATDVSGGGGGGGGWVGYPMIHMLQFNCVM